MASDFWQESIRSITPADFSQLDVKEIRKLLAVYLAALPTSPEEESQIWRTSQIVAARYALSGTQLSRYGESRPPTETG